MSGSLGTLTLDLVAKIGGFTGPLDQAGRSAKKSSKEMVDAAREASAAWGALDEAQNNCMDGVSDAWQNFADQAQNYSAMAADATTSVLGSPNTFKSYSTHPGVLVTVNNKGLKSTAAGRYQQFQRYWPHYRDLLKLPDFGPISQDKLALQLVKERGAVADVHAGRIQAAITKCRNIWASLPGAGYGQHERKLDDLLVHYIAAGGRLA